MGHARQRQCRIPREGASRLLMAKGRPGRAYERLEQVAPGKRAGEERREGHSRFLSHLESGGRERASEGGDDLAVNDDGWALSQVRYRLENGMWMLYGCLDRGGSDGRPTSRSSLTHDLSLTRPVPAGSFRGGQKMPALCCWSERDGQV